MKQNRLRRISTNRQTTLSVFFIASLLASNLFAQAFRTNTCDDFEGVGFLHLTDRSLVDTSFLGVNEKGDFTFRQQGSDRSIVAQSTELLAFYRHQNIVNVPPSGVMLVDGSIINGRLVGNDLDSLQLNSPIFRTISIPFSYIAAIIFDRQGTFLDTVIEGWLSASVQTEDILYLNDESVLFGVVNNLNAERSLIRDVQTMSLELRQNESLRRVSIANIAALRLSPILKRISPRSDDWLVVKWIDGSVLHAKSLQKKEDNRIECTLESGFRFACVSNFIDWTQVTSVFRSRIDRVKTILFGPEFLLQYRTALPWTYQPSERFYSIPDTRAIGQDVSDLRHLEIHANSTGAWKVDPNAKQLLGTLQLCFSEKSRTIESNVSGLIGRRSTAHMNLNSPVTKVKILSRRNDALELVWTSPDLSLSHNSAAVSVPLDKTDLIVIAAETTPEFSHLPKIFFDLLRTTN